MLANRGYEVFDNEVIGIGVHNPQSTRGVKEVAHRAAGFPQRILRIGEIFFLKMFFFSILTRPEVQRGMHYCYYK